MLNTALGHLRTMWSSNVTAVCVAALMTFSRILIVILKFGLLNYQAIVFLHLISARRICQILRFKLRFVVDFLFLMSGDIQTCVRALNHINRHSVVEPLHQVGVFLGIVGELNH